MARKRRIVEKRAKKGEARLDSPSSDPPESGTLVPSPNQEIAHEFETRAHQESLPSEGNSESVVNHPSKKVVNKTQPDSAHQESGSSEENDRSRETQREDTENHVTQLQTEESVVKSDQLPSEGNSKSAVNQPNKEAVNKTQPGSALRESGSSEEKDRSRETQREDTENHFTQP